MMKLMIGVLKIGGLNERRHRHTRARKRPLGHPGGRSKTNRRRHLKEEEMSRLKNRRGQGIVEYVLILVLMAVLSVGALHYLGKQTHNGIAQASDALTDQMNYSTSNGNKSGKIS